MLIVFKCLYIIAGDIHSSFTKGGSQNIFAIEVKDNLAPRRRHCAEKHAKPAMDRSKSGLACVQRVKPNTPDNSGSSCISSHNNNVVEMMMSET